jgi:hypothetical protein
MMIPHVSASIQGHCSSLHRCCSLFNHIMLDHACISPRQVHMVTGGGGAGCTWVWTGTMLLWPCSEPACGPALAHDVSKCTCNSSVVARATQGCRADGL